MEEKTILELIRNEIYTDSKEIKSQFKNSFEKEIENFIKNISMGYIAWKKFDSEIGNNEDKAHISSLLYSAISNQIVSMKLLVLGYLVPSGNIQRQIIETIAMALLSSKISLGFLARYKEQKYSTSLAIRDVLRNYSKLGINKKALQKLERLHAFYHNYSHPTLLTIGTFVSFHNFKAGHTYLGASFDEGKIKFYKKEFDTRLGIAEMFTNIILGIKKNLQLK